MYMILFIIIIIVLFMIISHWYKIMTKIIWFTKQKNLGKQIFISCATKIIKQQGENCKYIIQNENDLCFTFDHLFNWGYILGNIDYKWAGKSQNDNDGSEGFNADTKFFVRARAQAMRFSLPPLSAFIDMGPIRSADQD